MTAGRSLAFALVVLLAGGAASAQTPRHANCTKPEVAAIESAFSAAKRLAVTAAANVGPHPTYERWFGKYNRQSGERVRAALKSVVTAIRSGAVTTSCDNIGRDGCEPGTFAWVYPDEPYLVHICPNFFTMPTVAELIPGTPKSDDGTRGGTFIHEITHFLVVADTDDICYTRTECERMALRRPLDALNNADSYQYFAEDVTYEIIGGGLNP